MSHEYGCHRKPRAVATVAAPKLAIRLYWMPRTNTPYPDPATLHYLGELYRYHIGD